MCLHKKKHREKFLDAILLMIRGNKLSCPKIQIGQYVQGLVGGTNDTEQERSISTLYLSHMDNGSGHIAFKSDTKAVVSVNRAVVIPTLRTIVDQVNQLGASEKQPDGIQFINMDGKVTIHDLDLNRADDDNDASNVSDERLDHDKEYKKEFDNQTNRDEDLATDKNQEDYFQNPIQQQHLLLTNSKARSVVKPKRKLLTFSG